MLIDFFDAPGLNRCGKSCRLRWLNYLRGVLKRGNFSKEEDDLIVKLHATNGNRYQFTDVLVIGFSCQFAIGLIIRYKTFTGLIHLQRHGNNGNN